MKPALTPRAKRAWRSISGPCVATGAASTSATICTACGLPIETTATVDAAPVAQLDRPERQPRFDRARREPGRVERHVQRLEVGRAHVDGDAAVGLLAQLEAAVHGLDDERLLVAEAARADEADEAARAVAALLDLVAAGAVEDAVAEVDARACALGSTTRIWSAPTPKRRSASRRNLRGIEMRAARACASSTTKSLPAPCIFVKRSRMGRIIGPRTATARPAAAS